MKQEKLLLLFPLTGIYGLLFLAEGVDLLQFYRPAVYGFAAVFGLALWALAVFAGKFWRRLWRQRQPDGQWLFFWRGRSFWRNSGWRAGFSQGSIPARQ